MHHNIRNFSDATAIDPEQQLTITYRQHRHGDARCRVVLNDYVLSWDLATVRVGLFDDIKLDVEVVSGAVESVQLAVNGLEVLPRYQHLSSSGTNYLDQPGVWHLHIPAPFYTWYHSISGQGWIA